MKIVEGYKYKKKDDFIKTLRKAETDFCAQYKVNAGYLYGNSFIMNRIADYLNSSNSMGSQIKTFTIHKDYTEAFEDGQIPENLIEFPNEETGHLDALDEETGEVYDYTDILLQAGCISCGLAHNSEDPLEIVRNRKNITVYAVQTINEDEGLFLVLDDNLPDNQFILQHGGSINKLNLSYYSKVKVAKDK